MFLPIHICTWDNSCESSGRKIMSWLDDGLAGRKLSGPYMKGFKGFCLGLNESERASIIPNLTLFTSCFQLPPVIQPWTPSAFSHSIAHISQLPLWGISANVLKPDRGLPLMCIATLSSGLYDVLWGLPKEWRSTRRTETIDRLLFAGKLHFRNFCKCLPLDKHVKRLSSANVSF